jgi:hypothetical protein
MIYQNKEKILKDKIKHYIKQEELPEDFEWNDGYYLEGLDRIETIRIMIEAILANNPAIVLSGNNNNIDEVHKLLGEIYNSIAKMEIENEGSAII